MCTFSVNRVFVQFDSFTLDNGRLPSYIMGRCGMAGAGLFSSARMSSSMLFGDVVGKYLSMGFPRRSMRNLVKFHGIFPPVIQLAVPPCFSFKNFQRGSASSPFTFNFAKRSKVIPHFFKTRALISAFVPGS